MKLELEGKQSIECPSEAQVKRSLGRKKAGDNTYAILTAPDQSYIQMIGGGVGCCLEWRDTKQRKHYRGYQDPPIVPWSEESTVGSIILRPSEFFRIDQVVGAFISFLTGTSQSPVIKWREITDELKSYGIQI